MHCPTECHKDCGCDDETDGTLIFDREDDIWIPEPEGKLENI